jgi:hypothetical protein
MAADSAGRPALRKRKKAVNKAAAKRRFMKGS